MSEARFGLEFVGRKEVLAWLDAPARGTLEPDFARSIRFEQATNVLVEGDNLQVLGLLQRAYHRRVKMIYIDPPYNTGHDFIYRDRFSETVETYLRRTGQIDDRGNALVANPSHAGRHHSAWLAMMYPRLWVARQLLRDDGVLFVSIDDHEVHHLRMLLDEIFGADCFIAQIVVVTNRGGRDYLRVATGHEYLLCYGATPDAPIFELPRPLSSHGGRVLEDARGPYVLRELRNRNPKFHPGNRPNLFYPVWVDPSSATTEGLCSVALERSSTHTVRVEPRNKAGEGSVWRWSAKTLSAALVPGDPQASEVVARCRRDGVYNVYEKHRKATTRPRGLWDEPEMRSEQGTLDLRAALGAAVFDHPKPVAMVRRCLQMTTAGDDIVLDFFAGSGTTAQAVVEQNRDDGGRRHVVLVQLPEAVPPGSPAFVAGYRTITDITRARVASLGPEVGLRCFTLAAPEPTEAWLGPKTRDPEAYLAMLRARAEPSSPPGVFTLALAHGLSLAARMDTPDPDVVRLVDPHDGRTLVVSATGLDPARLEALDLPPETILCCPDGALDDASMLRLARRYDVHPW